MHRLFNFQLLFALIIILLVQNYYCESKLQGNTEFRGKRYFKSTDLLEVGENGGKKYYSANVGATWSQSIEICHFHGKVPATIELKSQLNFLSLHLKYSGKYVYSYFWTAGHDLLQEGHFQWLDDGNFPVDLNLPNKFRNTLDKNCLQVDFQNYLFDWECEDTTAIPLCQDGKVAHVQD